MRKGGCMQVDHGLKGENNDTGEAMPTKFGAHAYLINLYFHKFFELIPFFDSHGLYSPSWKFERKQIQKTPFLIFSQITHLNKKKVWHGNTVQLA